MAASPEIDVEIRGLRLSGRVGVTDAELEVEREIVIDLILTPVECRAVDSDAIEDTIDYAGVARVAHEVLDAMPYRTLERLAGAIADEIAERYAPAALTVRVSKPDPPMRERVADVSVVLRRGGS